MSIDKFWNIYDEAVPWNKEKKKIKISDVQSEWISKLATEKSHLGQRISTANRALKKRIHLYIYIYIKEFRVLGMRKKTLNENSFYKIERKKIDLSPDVFKIMIS